LSYKFGIYNDRIRGSLVQREERNVRDEVFQDEDLYGIAGTGDCFLGKRRNVYKESVIILVTYCANLWGRYGS